MSLHNTLLIVGAAQALFAAALLVVAPRPEGPATRWLGAFVAAYGLTFAASTSALQSLYVNIPLVAPLAFLAFLSLGPLIYGYTVNLTTPEGEIAFRRPWRHIAVIGVGVMLISAWIGLSPADREASIAGELDAQDVSTVVLAVILLGALAFGQLQFLYYLVVSIRRLFAHGLRVRDVFSNLENKTLNWLRTLLLILIIVWFADTATDIADQADHFSQAGELIFTASELLILYAFSFFGVRQPAVFGLSPNPSWGAASQVENVVPLHGGQAGAITAKGAADQPPKSPRYEKSALSDDRMAVIADKLENAMASDRLFESPTLTLAELSRHVGVQQSYVSQTLNQKIGRKFYDYIALHRVEAAKELLSEKGDRNTILDIALAVGFNSKSTFNAAFKKHVNMTPTSFRSQVTDAA